MMWGGQPTGFAHYFLAHEGRALAFLKGDKGTDLFSIHLQTTAVSIFEEFIDLILVV